MRESRMAANVPRSCDAGKDLSEWPSFPHRRRAGFRLELFWLLRLRVCIDMCSLCEGPHDLVGGHQMSALIWDGESSDASHWLHRQMMGCHIMPASVALRYQLGVVGSGSYALQEAKGKYGGMDLSKVKKGLDC